jgi:hypothetical protein
MFQLADFIGVTALIESVEVCISSQGFPPGDCALETWNCEARQAAAKKRVRRRKKSAAGH